MEIKRELDKDLWTIVRAKGTIYYMDCKLENDFKI